MNFIVEITSGGWREGSEDRLTQIIVGAFNESPVFARLFCKFLGLSYRNMYSLESQLPGPRSRVDIALYDKNKNLLGLIESKTESKTNKKQNENHEKINVVGKRYFQITKYPDLIRPSEKWKRLSWAEFANQLVFYIESAKCTKNNFDYRLINGVVKWFKEYDFMKNTIFTKKDVLNTCNLILFIKGREVEYKKWKSIPGSVHLESFNSLVEATDYTVSLLKVKMFTDKTFVKKLSGKYRESANLTRSWWNDDFVDVKKKKSSSDYLYWNEKKIFSIEKTIRIKKDKSTGATGLVFGLSFGTLKAGDKERRPHFVIGISYGSSWNPIKLIELKKNYTADKISEIAFKIWKKQLT